MRLDFQALQVVKCVDAAPVAVAEVELVGVVADLLPVDESEIGRDRAGV